MAATRSGRPRPAVYTDSGKYQLTPVEDNVFGFIRAPKQAEGADVKIESDLFLPAPVPAAPVSVAATRTTATSMPSSSAATPCS